VSERIKVLYLQHAGELGGSSMSLLYTMQGMRELGFECVVALARPSDPVRRLYADDGFETIDCAGLSLWDHSTVAPRPLWDPRSWRMLAGVARGWRRTGEETLKLVDRIKPAIVHLNSMPFVGSADALTRKHIPFVWHVREPPPDQGLRTRLISRVMRRAPQMIFISKFDRQQWVGGTTGEVIWNFVELDRFRPDADGSSVRASQSIPQDAKVILYLGGVSAVKGVFVLLDALRLLKDRGVRFVCLMPGTVLDRSKSWQGRLAGKLLPLIGSGTPKQHVRSRLSQYALSDNVRPVSFASDIVPFFAASDVVVFPATKPHFARPVIESIAMGKPAVGSNVGGVRELLDVHPLGVLTTAGDPIALADAIQDAISGESSLNGRAAEIETARKRFDRRAATEAIAAISRRLLK
jgi:glycosyltransferase involved in cell wall biosynthesis